MTKFIDRQPIFNLKCEGKMILGHYLLFKKKRRLVALLKTLYFCSTVIK